METRTILHRFAVVAAIILGVIAVAGRPATAEGTGKAAQPLTVVHATNTKSLSVTATFTFPSVTDGTAEAEELRRSLAEVMRNSRTSAFPEQDVHCNVGYSWFDENVTFSYQHACRGSTCPWGLTIQPSVQAIISGLVTEQGMDWAENYHTMPRQAGHVVPKDYWFHGTFNPCLDYDIITCYDVFTFRINIGGNIGSGRITIRCELHNLPN